MTTLPCATKPRQAAFCSARDKFPAGPALSSFWFLGFRLCCGFMAHIEPFPALRPRPQIAGELCELPYDVMSSAEARQMARGKPYSFLHVSKPEIDLPEATDPYSPTVYEKGRENFSRLM